MSCCVRGMCAKHMRARRRALWNHLRSFFFLFHLCMRLQYHAPAGAHARPPARNMTRRSTQTQGSVFPDPPYPLIRPRIFLALRNLTMAGGGGGGMKRRPAAAVAPRRLATQPKTAKQNAKAKPTPRRSGRHAPGSRRGRADGRTACKSKGGLLEITRALGKQPYIIRVSPAI